MANPHINSQIDKEIKAVTLDDFLDDVISFLQANRNVSELEFKCLLEKEYPPQKEKQTSVVDELSSAKASDIKSLHSNGKNCKKQRYLLWPAFVMMMLMLLMGSRTAQRAIHMLVKSQYDIPPLYEVLYHVQLRPARMVSTYFGLARNEEIPECYLENMFPPWKEKHQSAGQDECLCAKVKHIVTARPSSDQNIPIEASVIRMQPILLRQWGSKKSSVLEELSASLMEMSEMLRSVPNFVTSNLEAMTSIDDLTDRETLNDVISNSSHHIEWFSSYYISCSLMKRLFPLPEVIRKDYFDTQRYVILDGADSNAYELPANQHTAVYIQGRGARKLILMPQSAHCSHRCHHLAVRLEAGDILIFSATEWKARSECVDGLPSIASLAILM